MKEPWSAPRGMRRSGIYPTFLSCRGRDDVCVSLSLTQGTQCPQGICGRCLPAEIFLCSPGGSPARPAREWGPARAPARAERREALAPLPRRRVPSSPPLTCLTCLHHCGRTGVSCVLRIVVWSMLLYLLRCTNCPGFGRGEPPGGARGPRTRPITCVCV